MGIDPLTGKKINGKNGTPKKIALVKDQVIISPPHGIWIPGNVPSQKNSQTFGIGRDHYGNEIIKGNGKKLTRVYKSPTVVKYKKTALPDYIKRAKTFQELIKGYSPPYTVYYKLIRQTKGVFDYNNSSHVITDLMKVAGWIQDDSAEHIIFIPIRAGYNPNAPGVFIIA
jgi:hypothetical protein